MCFLIHSPWLPWSLWNVNTGFTVVKLKAWMLKDLNVDIYSFMSVCACPNTHVYAPQIVADSKDCELILTEPNSFQGAQNSGKFEIALKERNVPGFACDLNL